MKKTIEEALDALHAKVMGAVPSPKVRVLQVGPGHYNYNSPSGWCWCDTPNSEGHDIGSRPSLKGA